MLLKRLALVAIGLAVAGTLYGWLSLARALGGASPPRTIAIEGTGIEECRPPLVAVGDQVWALCRGVGGDAQFVRLDLATGHGDADWSFGAMLEMRVHELEPRLESSEPPAGEPAIHGLIPRDDGGVIVLVGDELIALEPGGKAWRLGAGSARVLGAVWSRARGLEVAAADPQSPGVSIRTLASTTGEWSKRGLAVPAHVGELHPEAAFHGADGWQVLYVQRVREEEERVIVAFYRAREGGELEPLGERTLAAFEIGEAIADHSRGHVFGKLGTRKRGAPAPLRWTEQGLEGVPRPPGGAEQGIRADFVVAPDGRGLTALLSADRGQWRFVGGRWLRFEANGAYELSLAEAGSRETNAVATWPSLSPEEVQYVLVPGADGGVVLLDSEGAFARVGRDLERSDPLTRSERMRARLPSRLHLSGTWAMRGELVFLFGYPLLAGLAALVARLRKKPALPSLAIAAALWLPVAVLMREDFTRFLAAC